MKRTRFSLQLAYVALDLLCASFAFSQSTRNLTDSEWKCDMAWSTTWDQIYADGTHNESRSFRHNELLTFKQGGTYKLDPILSDGKVHSELEWNDPARIIIMNTDRWSYDDLSVSFTIESWVPPVTFVGSRIAPDQIRFVPTNPPDGFPSAHQSGSYVCSKYGSGSGKQWSAYPPLQLIDTKLSTPRVRRGDTVTIFFGVHDPRPDKPITWLVERDQFALSELVGVSPPGSQHTTDGERGTFRSGDHVAVTFRIVRGLSMSATLTFIVKIFKDEIVNESGDMIQITNCSVPGTTCPNDFKVQYSPDGALTRDLPNKTPRAEQDRVGYLKQISCKTRPDCATSPTCVVVDAATDQCREKANGVLTRDLTNKVPRAEQDRVGYLKQISCKTRPNCATSPTCVVVDAATDQCREK